MDKESNNLVIPERKHPIFLWVYQKQVIKVDKKITVKQNFKTISQTSWAFSFVQFLISS